MVRLLFFSLLCIFMWSCGSPDKAPATPPEEGASISEALDRNYDEAAATRLIDRIKMLSSDDFQGRMPASVGEEKTVAFLVSEFERVGAGPGNGESFMQPVPLVEITGNPEARLRINADGRELMDLAMGGKMAGGTRRVQEEVEVSNSEMVFVGYGIVAPEYNWDDYAGLDVKGKTVVMLVNDPGYATGNDALFNGNAMTYYGRWTYKYEEAARQGADMAIIIHEEGAAGYPWAVVTSGWTGPQFDLVGDGTQMSPAKVEAWVDNESGSALLKRAGLSYEDAVKAASTGGFQAVSLNASASITIRNKLRKMDSQNVIAMIRGSERPDEYIIYSAHWDHLGRDTALADDPIYNGARDNATGTAALLTLAEKFKAMPDGPERSVIFLAVTAEESGLLGSRFYAENPVVPLEKTVANINMDSLGIYGPTHDIAVIGFGNSELEEYLARAVEAQGRTAVREPTPEKGFFYRSDHFNFAKRGVPALYFKSGIDFVGKGKEWGRKTEAEHIATRYHKPADEYFAETWSPEGLMLDIALYFEIGRALSMESGWPNWYAGNEFRAARDASAAARQ
ncbi:MAG: M28 family peptidase [Gammaproteobacteria bacterium]|nr:M28 family peptidase [Gammaproteobacteria bacterium]